MTIDQFTASRRSLIIASSRRGLLIGLAASSLVAGSQDLAAKRKGKHKRKKRNKKGNPDGLPQVRTDAQCAGANGAAVDGLPDGRVAQSFIAIQSGELVGADLVLTELGNSQGDYIPHLAPVDAFGFPTNEVLASTSLTGEQVPDGAPTTATFTFTQPALVAAGTQYALVLSRPEVGIFGWRGRVDNGCTGRAFTSDDRTSPFVGAGQNVDLVFTTFVRS